MNGRISVFPVNNLNPVFALLNGVEILNTHSVPAFSYALVNDGVFGFIVEDFGNGMGRMVAQLDSAVKLARFQELADVYGIELENLDEVELECETCKTRKSFFDTLFVNDAVICWSDHVESGRWTKLED